MKYTLLFIALTSLGILSSCSKDDSANNQSSIPTIVETSDCTHPPLNLMECTAPIDSTLQDGFHIVYFDNTNIKMFEGNFNQFQANGFWKEYYEDGSLFREGNYSNGKRDGFWKQYSKVGELEYEGHFTNCKRTGFWKFYHSNGVVSEDGNFNADVKTGNWNHYSTSSKIIQIIKYDC